MSSKMKQWVAIAAVAVLVILAGGWFLLVSPKRHDAQDLQTQADSVERSNQSLSVQLATLRAQAKDLPRQQAVLAAVAAKIPDNPAMPTLIRSLNAAAADTGVELVSLAPTAPAAVVAPAAPTTTASAATATGVPASTASAAGLQQIQVAVNVVGSYFQVAEYLDRLEGLQRAFRVTTFTAAPGTNPVKDAASQPSADSGKLLTATITGYVYESPGSTSATVSNGK